MKVYSFDIFDTVVTRITADPIGVFYKLQEKIRNSELTLPSALVEHFAELRVESEKAARRKKTQEEIAFAEIYDELGRRFDLSGEIREQLMALEIETEIECIRAIPVNLRRVHNLRRDGKRVIFVSDMYLPLPVIRRILEKAGIFSEGDEIYISSENWLTKSTGNLYLEVFARENCDPRQLLDVGDNRRSDCLMARKIGKVSAHHFREGHLNRFEKILREPSGGMEFKLTWQLIAGASRVARLQSQEQPNEHRRVLHEIGANVVGPILWGFVSWVLTKAEARKLRRLYFVARDGQILYDIAGRLCAAASSDIELRYFYGSRQAWHLPAVTEITAKELHWITVKDPYLTVRLVATRLCLEPDALLGQLCETGFPAVGLDEDLDSSQAEHLKAILISDTQVKNLILTRAEQERQVVAAYLRQEGLLEDSSWAIVDSGWNGRLQDSLSRILTKAGMEEKPLGFYFGLLNKGEAPETKMAYFFSPEGRPAYLNLGGFVINLIELMMTADHGVTLGYRSDETGHLRPTLSPTVQGWFESFGFDALRTGVSDFLDHLDPALNLDHNYFREKIYRLLEAFYLSPPRNAAAALGYLPFSTDQTESLLLRFAPPLSLWEALRFLTARTAKDRFARTFWLHGSRVQSAWPVNLLLLTISLIFRVGHFLVRSMMRKKRHP